MELKDIKGVKSVSALIPLRCMKKSRPGKAYELYDAMIEYVDKATTGQVCITMNEDVKLGSYSAAFKRYLQEDHFQGKYEFSVSVSKHIVTCRKLMPGEIKK